jgi:hypothetical protein
MQLYPLKRLASASWPPPEATLAWHLQQKR